MIIGVPAEIKVHEYRVGMTPAGVHEAVAHGHQVLVQTRAGMGIGCADTDYVRAGAEMVADAESILGRAELIIKVKEPQPTECRLLRAGQILFTYLHLAPDPVQADLLLAAGCTAIAYETVTDVHGALPLLAPMSEIAGRMAIQVGATSLEKVHGGAGILLGGVPGVEPARVVILGGGVVGTNALRVALGMGADVVVLDRSMHRLTELDTLYGPRLKTVFATAEAIDHHITQADLVIGAVLVPGATAPRLINRQQLGRMKAGSVLVDVAIDQGGCFETSRPTTHAEPTYVLDGIVHYCVANMPGGVARTATLALTNATLPYILTIADKGWRRAALDDNFIAAGINVHAGNIVHPTVAAALGRTPVPPVY
ncbi:MAG: alanine dehydrogenase [Magnetococcales bacterium]|nr:alanine dehydrogenase [Magnetococcales bacterium]